MLMTILPATSSNRITQTWKSQITLTNILKVTVKENKSKTRNPDYNELGLINIVTQKIHTNQ